MLSDRERDLLALRAIEVSARAALRHAAALNREAVLDVIERTMDLLELLEPQVVAHGADDDVLAAISYVRRELWSDRTAETRRAD